MWKWPSQIKWTSVNTAEFAVTTLHHMSSCDLCDLAVCVKELSTLHWLCTGCVSDDRQTMLPCWFVVRWFDKQHARLYVQNASERREGRLNISCPVSLVPKLSITSDCSGVQMRLSFCSTNTSWTTTYFACCHSQAHTGDSGPWNISYGTPTPKVPMHCMQLMSLSLCFTVGVRTERQQ